MAALSSGRLAYIHHARGLAILGVLLIHTNDMMKWPSHSIGDHIGAALYNITACFVFISGYLFQHLAPKFEYAGYLKRKFRNVVLPYLIVSIPAILVYLIAHKSHPWLPDDFFAQSPFAIVGYFLLTGQHLGPLWFMPMIFLYYLAAPVFIWIDKRPWAYGLIIPALALSVMVGRPEHNENPMQSFVALLPAYLIGMAASRWKEQLNPLLARYFWALVALSAISIAASLAFLVSPNFSLIAKVPLCFAMIAVFQRYPAWRLGWLDYFAGISFGLYFTHSYVVGAGRFLEARYPGLFHLSSFELIGAYVVVLALSVIAVEIIRAGSGRWSRMVIGVPPRSPPPHPPLGGVAEVT